MIPFAHAAHLLEIPIYGGPVILLVAWFKLGAWRERRRERRSQRPRRP
ncbi:MAG: hypothetical protein ACXVRH_14270 [Thermoleophilaceae bacterium]